MKSARKRTAILRAIIDAGVGCVRFSERVPLDQYVAMYNGVDIALDSFPYGGATTLDALYMGAPVATSVSCNATSVLEALGVQDWIAPR